MGLNSQEWVQSMFAKVPVKDDMYWDDDIIIKNYGSYIQFIIRTDSIRGYDTYDFYIDENERVIKIFSYEGNELLEEGTFYPR